MNANQPHQSTNNPMHALTGFPMGNGAKPFAYRPSRGPKFYTNYTQSENMFHKMRRSIRLLFNKVLPSIMAEANADAPPALKLYIHYYLLEIVELCS